MCEVRVRECYDNNTDARVQNQKVYIRKKQTCIYSREKQTCIHPNTLVFSI